MKGVEIYSIVTVITDQAVVETWVDMKPCRLRGQRPLGEIQVQMSVWKPTQKKVLRTINIKQRYEESGLMFGSLTHASLNFENSETDTPVDFC
jgi:hypothetical protein